MSRQDPDPYSLLDKTLGIVGAVFTGAILGITLVLLVALGYVALRAG